MATLNSDSALEAFATYCTESEIDNYFKNDLTESGRRRLATIGPIAIARAMQFNKEAAGVLRVLLDRREIQVNRRIGPDGNTILHIAVLLPDGVELVRMLLTLRPDLDPDAGNRTADTALHFAAQPGASLEILDVLVSDPRVNVAALNNDKQTPLHAACQIKNRINSRGVDSRQAEVVRALVNAAAAKVKSVPEFLQRVDALGRNALHYAAESGLDATAVEILRIAKSSGLNSEMQLVRDSNGFQPVHLATQNGHLKVVEHLLPLTLQSCTDCTLHECLKLCSAGSPKLCSAIHLYDELLTITAHHHVAEYLLKTYEEHIDEKKCASLLHWAVKIKDLHCARLIPLILKWRREKANEPLDADDITALIVATKDENVDAVKALCRADRTWELDGTKRDKHKKSALDYAFLNKNKRIQRILLEQSDVKGDLARVHKHRETHTAASNALLVVSVLVVTLTYTHCLTSSEVKKRRDEGTLQTEFRLANQVMLTKIAFFLSMVSTILAAFAALPFSFGIFFVQTVDDHYVRQSLNRTRVLVVLASNFLMLSLGAIVFEFLCSQYIAPYIHYQCEIACEIVLGLFVLLSVVFLAPNLVRFWRARRAKVAKQARKASGRRVCPEV